VFAAIVYEDRRPAEWKTPGRTALGKLANEVDRAVRRFVAVEAEQGVQNTIKVPDYGIVPAVLAWSHGGTIDDMERILQSDGGDVVRTLRMAIQMMRQLRKALSGDYQLIDRLDEAIVSVNRDEVDAKRQFELG
jgi:superfamily II RNA helicase